MKSVVRFMIPAAAVASVAFASIGSTGAPAAAPNVAAGQPAQWVAAAFTVPTVVIPVDGDGNEHPGVPHQHNYGLVQRHEEQLVPLRHEVAHRVG